MSNFIKTLEQLSEGTSYKVFKNGKFTGTIETNYEWAKNYYKNKENEDIKYKLVPVKDENLTKESLDEHSHDMSKEKHHKDCQCARCKPLERPCDCKHCREYRLNKSK